MNKQQTPDRLKVRKKLTSNHNETVLQVNKSVVPNHNEIGLQIHKAQPQSQ